MKIVQWACFIQPCNMFRGLLANGMFWLTKQSFTPLRNIPNSLSPFKLYCFSHSHSVPPTSFPEVIVSKARDDSFRLSSNHTHQLHQAAIIPSSSILTYSLGSLLLFAYSVVLYRFLFSILSFSCTAFCCLFSAPSRTPRPSVSQAPPCLERGSNRKYAA